LLVKKLIAGVGSTGLDDGPYFSGKAPRKKPTPKTAEELSAIRAKAWETRRAASGIGSHAAPVRGWTDTWLTPRWILDALGDFDTDPCCPDPMPWQTAATMYTERDNGLMMPWDGRVWLNPPYGDQTGVWLDLLAGHGNGIALIFARTETEMFHRFVWDRADGVLFLKGRIHFHTQDGQRAHGNAGGPSCLVAYGEPNVEALRACGIPGKLVVLDPTSTQGSYPESGSGTPVSPPPLTRP
jgi:hypothetical protein